MIDSEKWFAHLSVYQNHPEGLLKHRLLSSTQASDLVGLVCGWRTYADDADKDWNFENHYFRDTLQPVVANEMKESFKIFLYYALLVLVAKVILSDAK